MRCLLPCFCLLLLASVIDAQSIAAEPSVQIDFDREIAPLIAQRCLDCHSGSEPKGKLDLSTRAMAMAGGESGKVIVPGELDDSLLWEQIDSGEMPPKHPLAAAEKALFQNWIASGAKWGSDKIDPFRFTTESRAGYDWWSLQPLVKQEPPAVPNSDREEESDRRVCLCTTYRRRSCSVGCCGQANIDSPPFV